MSVTQPHIVLAGGGTGGHLFPGLAVAGQLSADLPQARITFAGSGAAWEQRHVTSAGYQYVAIPCHPMPRRSWQAFRFATDNLAGYWAARWFLREQRVSLVVGLGGYASAPPVRAAIAHDLPTVLLEANAVPGRVTRWLASSASLVCAAFPQVKLHLKHGVHLRVTGNPLRPQFSRLSIHHAPRDASYLTPHCPSNPNTRSVMSTFTTGINLGARRLLVLGGSGGAQSLNENVPRALYKLGPALRDWQIVHQTGPGQVHATQELYQKLDLEAVVVSFIDNLAEVLRETDLVVCRAGGTTLAELMAAGLPAVLVPYPDSADQHQLANAKALASAGACVLVEEPDSPDRLDDRLVLILQALLADDHARMKLSATMQKLARPDATREVAALIAELLQPAAMQMAA